MASIKLKGDTSGEITIQAPSVAGTNTLNLQASSGTLATTAQASIGMKNLIINGDMRIDQRGGTVTINTASRTYGVDRWLGYGQSSDGVFTIVQDTEAPTGFLNSTKITTTTADASVGASQYYILGQSIEGTNFSHLSWGSASAKTVTLSFWVRSSLTGTFGGAINNNAANRSYPFTYTIDSANTWEQKSVTITGDTSGTWITTTGIGANVWFDLGCGTSNVGIAGTWSPSGYFGANGTTSLIGTSGATLYITGVQLEANTTATPFEQIQYGTQLALCQRYYWKNKGNNTGDILSGFGEIYNTANGQVPFYLPVPMRVAYSSYSVEWQDVQALVPSTASYTVTGIAIANGTYTTVLLNFVSSGMTAGKNPYLRTSSVNGYIAISGEL